MKQLVLRASTNPLVKGGALLLGLAGAFLAGRLLARPAHVEETHTRAVEASRTAEVTRTAGTVAVSTTASSERTAATVAHTASAASRKATRRRRVTERPDGTRVTVDERTDEATVLAEATEAAIEKARDDARREMAASYEDEIRRLEERLKTAEASTRVTTEAPRWAVGAFASRTLDGRTGWGPEVGARVLGPAYVGVGVDVPARGAMVRVWLTVP